MNENFEPDFSENPVDTPTATIPNIEPPSENVLAGTVGAFLFALAGGVLWFILWQIGYIAALSGIVAVICAIKGYSVFSKRESVKGVVISVVMSIIVIVIAWYICLSYDIFLAYKEWFANGEIDFEITLFEAIRSAYLYLQEPEIARSYLGSLGLGALFCIIGCIGTVKSAVTKAKNAVTTAKEQNS